MAPQVHQLSLMDYFSCQDKAKRIDILRNLPHLIEVSLVRDLLCLNLSHEEQILLLQRADPSDNTVYESLMLESLTTTHQDIAVVALQLWTNNSSKFQAETIAELISSPKRPQRLLYRLLEASLHLGGKVVVERVIENPMLESLAPAFHALLLNRAVWHNYPHQMLDSLAGLATAEIDSNHERLYEKSLPGALAYIARFNPGKLAEIAENIAAGSVWRSLIHAIVSDTLDKKTIKVKVDQILTQAKRNEDLNLYTLSCLPMWSRHFLTGSQVSSIAEAFSGAENTNKLWQCLAGVEVKTIIDAIAHTKSNRANADLLAIAEQLCDTTTRIRLGEVALEANKRCNGELAPMLTARVAKLAGIERKETKQKSTALRDHGKSRKLFFDFAYRNIGKNNNDQADDDLLFAALSKAWESRSDQELDQISELARKSPGIWTYCYIHCLGRFAQSDKAVLKLLDFIRSNDETVVRAVIQALHRINSPRASLELVSALTRPNTSMQIKLEISNMLKDLDLNSLQAELRSALNDMPSQVDTGSIHYEIRDNITALLAPVKSESQGIVATIGDHSELDQWLAKKIDSYPELSSEVKRALRTARFFHVTATNSTLSSIDLSPAVDMQYKALELSFREMFEHVCGELIESGHIQRKLDVIGYARPIESSMSQFENYISNLPVIANIPFFSKFKLRKMLRAICQYRPGKRFTLDGIKAFALFFLVFGRKECRYGLAQMMSLPFKNDNDLAEFCRLLHIFQDTRNRAAHEGFQPDASKDIDAIWTWTSEIYKQAVTMNKHFGTASTSAPVDSRRSDKPGPQIVYKKAAS